MKSPVVREGEKWSLAYDIAAYIMRDDKRNPARWQIAKRTSELVTEMENKSLNLYDILGELAKARTTESIDLAIQLTEHIMEKE